MRQVNLRLPEDLVDAIDELRGNVPRDRFLRAIVGRHLHFYAGCEGFRPVEFVREVEDGDPVLMAVVAAVDTRRDGQSRLGFIFAALDTEAPLPD